MSTDFRFIKREGYGTCIGTMERAGKVLITNSVLLPKLPSSETDLEIPHKDEVERTSNVDVLRFRIFAYKTARLQLRIER
jgi:hypothetical protein